MPETALRLLAGRFEVRKSVALSLPYDWPNPAITDTTLIQAVLRRARFAVLVRVCIEYGLPVVQAQFHMVDEFDKSERGAGGFGSTGTH